MEDEIMKFIPRRYRRMIEVGKAFVTDIHTIEDFHHGIYCIFKVKNKKGEIIFEKKA